MSERVDELFGAGAPAARPRVGLALALLHGGLFLSLLGLACSVVPGVVVVLLAWVVVQRDLDRVDSGYLPVVDRPGLLVVRAFVVLAVVLDCGFAALQLVAMYFGAYDDVWVGMLRTLRGLL